MCSSIGTPKIINFPFVPMKNLSFQFSQILGTLHYIHLSDSGTTNLKLQDTIALGNFSVQLFPSSTSLHMGIGQGEILTLDTMVIVIVM